MVVSSHLKGLLPSLREKKRYVGFTLVSSSSFVLSQVTEAVSQCALKLFGSLGVARMGIVFLPDWHKQSGILRVHHQHVDRVKALFALMTHIEGFPISLRSFVVSGTLAQVRKKVGGGR